MDNSQHWYVPQNKKAITSERMVSEIIMMNKQKIKAVLKYLQSGAMCWMVTLPADEVCDEEWIMALIYNRDFSMPHCKEPFTAMMARPSKEELIAAIEKGGYLKTDFIIPVNTAGKSDMTCVEAVENLIRWRKTIYPFLDFTPDEEPENQEEPEQELVTEAIGEITPAEPEAETVQAEKQEEKVAAEGEAAEGDESAENYILSAKEALEEQLKVVRSVDEILKDKPGFINQHGAFNIISGETVVISSDTANFKVIPDTELITESPDEPEEKRYMITPDTSDDEDDGEFVVPEYSDKSGICVDDVPLSE